MFLAESAVTDQPNAAVGWLVKQLFLRRHKMLRIEDR
jgi:hypothetical protein